MNVVDDDGVHPLPFSPERVRLRQERLRRAASRRTSATPASASTTRSRTPNYFDEVIVFLGASYFRAVGRDKVFGLSARGLAIDTVEPSGEEFPYFTRVLAGDADADATSTLVLYALLDSPSVTGAYRFVVEPGEQTRGRRRGAPLPAPPGRRSSASRRSPACSSTARTATRRFDDFRPEVHDSDGLLLQLRQRRVALAAARQPARARRQQLPHARPARLRPDPARPRLRPLPGPRDPRRAAAERLGRAARRLGRRATSSWSRSRPRPSTNDNIVAFWVPDDAAASRASR